MTFVLSIGDGFVYEWIQLLQRIYEKYPYAEVETTDEMGQFVIDIHTQEGRYVEEGADAFFQQLAKENALIHWYS